MQRSGLLYMSPGKMAERLEVELINVCSVENGWWAKQHDVISADSVAAQLASRERLADSPLDRALDQQGRDITGQVAQIAGVPQLKALDRAILHILAQLVRR